MAAPYLIKILRRPLRQSLKLQFLRPERVMRFTGVSLFDRSRGYTFIESVALFCCASSCVCSPNALELSMCKACRSPVTIRQS